MPYVPQTRHIERVRSAIEARGPRAGEGASPRLVSSYRRSLEQYHLDPGATVGPRILTTPELRDIRQREHHGERSVGAEKAEDTQINAEERHSRRPQVPSAF